MAAILSKPNSKGGTVFLKTTMASSSVVAAPHNSTVCKPPPPPIRRSSSICSTSSQDRTSTFRTSTNEDEDLTPHGSMENVNVLSPNQDRLSLEAMVAKASNVASNLTNFQGNSSTLRRSTSMSTNENTVPSQQQQNFDRDQFLRRSLTLTSRSDRANLINSLTERISQRAKISTHHVIPVNGAAGAPVNKPNKNNNKQPSPEAEIYGFGAKFKEARQQYFDMSASYPASSMSAENQKFLDNLSSKLLNKDLVNHSSAAMPDSATSEMKRFWWSFKKTKTEFLNSYSIWWLHNWLLILPLLLFWISYILV